MELPEFKDYNFVEIIGDNIGILKAEEKEVVYYYEKKTGKIIVKYIVKKIPDSTSPDTSDINIWIYIGITIISIIVIVVLIIIIKKGKKLKKEYMMKL